MRKKILAVTLLLTGLLVSCGGGSGSVSSEAINSGQFYDSPVANVEYSTSSGLSGKTDDNGTFKYRNGDTITFKIGDVVLGTTEARKIITPIDLVSNNTENVLIISAFLLALDEDDDPSNGIQVKSDNLSIGEEVDLSNCTIDELPDEIETMVNATLDEANKHLSESMFDLLNVTLQELDGKKITFQGPNMLGSCYFELNDINSTERTITAKFTSCEGDMEDDNVTFSVENGIPYLYEGDGKKDIVLSIDYQGFCLYTDDIGKICVKQEE